MRQRAYVKISGKRKVWAGVRVNSKSTTNRCATINVNGHADHDYFLRFLEMSIHQLIGPLIWR